MFIKEIENLVKEIIFHLNYDNKMIKISKSNHIEMCDYQCDDCFKLAKIYNKNPMEIGQQIVDEINKMEKFDEYFLKVELAKPGFINFTLSNKFINTNLNKMKNKENFNISKPDNNELYFLDYGGPNVAKPLHVGHLRPAIIGESLNRIIQFKGYKTISDVHLGDYGLQIGQVIYSILNDKISISDLTLEYLEEAYPKISALCKENEEINLICSQITKDLQDKNEKYLDYWKKICELSVNDIKRIYDNLGVSFDIWNGESDSFEYMDKLMEYLEKQNIVVNSNQAKIIEVKEENDLKEMPPFILQKSNGAYLYSTTDLATIYERMEKYKPNYILYVVDARQKLHFEQVFRAAKKSKIVTDTKLEHIWFGTMNGLDGKPFKTRNGDLLKLNDLFDETKKAFLKLKNENINMSNEDINKIVNAIIKYADLQNNRERNYIFDINKFSEVVGKTGPYILYTYLRIKKLLETSDIKEFNNDIYNKNDRELRIKLIELEFAINNAFNERMPHYIADYIYDLCCLANTFYQNNRLSNLKEKEIKNQWILLLNLTNKILEKMLYLLTIEIPTIM